MRRHPNLLHFITVCVRERASAGVLLHLYIHIQPVVEVSQPEEVREAQ